MSTALLLAVHAALLDHLVYILLFAKPKQMLLVMSTMMAVEKPPRGIRLRFFPQ